MTTPAAGSGFTLRQKHFIDSHKAVTGLFVLLLMAFYNHWDNPTAWIYLALHGTYGLLWVLKSRFFPDKSWEQPCGIGYGLVIWAGLTTYWAAPLILIAGDVRAPGWYLALCVSLYTVGVFWHFAADMHKHTALRLQPGVLITDGLWALSRNPNYFGELLIYLSFGLLARHWLPLALLAAFVGIYWTRQMCRKDQSLARYPGFAAYKARTKQFIPFVW
jgi:protein-S-isoprenylcysteine O-methyltransferase Ste14